MEEGGNLPESQERRVPPQRGEWDATGITRDDEDFANVDEDRELGEKNNNSDQEESVLQQEQGQGVMAGVLGSVLDTTALLIGGVSGTWSSRAWSVGATTSTKGGCHSLHMIRKMQMLRGGPHIG